MDSHAGNAEGVDDVVDTDRSGGENKLRDRLLAILHAAGTTLAPAFEVRRVRFGVVESVGRDIL